MRKPRKFLDYVRQKKLRQSRKNAASRRERPASRTAASRFAWIANLARRVTRIRVIIWSLVAFGAVLLAYAPVVDAIKHTQPAVDLRLGQRGELVPFVIRNESGIFSMHNYTPRCVVTLAVWLVDGNLLAVWQQPPPPPPTNSQLKPGEASNFVCNLDSVMRRPTASRGAQQFNVRLLEVRMQVEVAYRTQLGPFSIQRNSTSQTFCGIARPDGYLWSSGETVTDGSRLATEVDRRSLYDGFPSRCFTTQDFDRLVGYQEMPPITPTEENQSAIIQFPPDGPFGGN